MGIFERDEHLQGTESSGRGPWLAHGRINFHLHSESVRETAPFMCGSEGRLPVSMCLCDLRKGGFGFNICVVLILTSL